MFFFAVIIIFSFIFFFIVIRYYFRNSTKHYSTQLFLPFPRFSDDSTYKSFSNVYFFSYSDIQNFFFTIYKDFDLFDYFDFKKSLSSFNFSQSRSIFLNRSLPFISAFTFIKFSKYDFIDINFSSDSSIIFGTFTVRSYSFSSSYNSYFFVFCLTDFSFSLFINVPFSNSFYFPNNFYAPNVFPVAFFKLSKIDFKILFDIIKASKEFSSLFNLKDLKAFKFFFLSIFGNYFLPKIFSTLPIPIFNPNLVYFKDYFYYQSFIYSNIDANFSFSNYELEYFSYSFISKHFFKDNASSSSKFWAFSFFKNLILFFRRGGMVDAALSKRALRVRVQIPPPAALFCSSTG